MTSQVTPGPFGHYPAEHTTHPEFGIERLIPGWATNPLFPPGQPFPGPQRVEWHFKTREAAEAHARDYRFEAYRVMVRDVTDWRPADA